MVSRFHLGRWIVVSLLVKVMSLLVKKLFVEKVSHWGRLSLLNELVPLIGKVNWWVSLSPMSELVMMSEKVKRWATDSLMKVLLMKIMMNLWSKMIPVDVDVALRSSRMKVSVTFLWQGKKVNGILLLWRKKVNVMCWLFLINSRWLMLIDEHVVIRVRVIAIFPMIRRETKLKVNVDSDDVSWWYVVRESINFFTTASSFPTWKKKVWWKVMVMLKVKLSFGR